MSDQNGQSGLPTGKHTLVEEGTEFKGSMTSKCPIVVMGKVEGDVAGPEIHVSATGIIAGNVKVKELRSEGEVAGEVEAETVRISGKVRDRTVIRARALEVSLSTTKGGMQVVFGECELAVGDEPNKDAAIAAAIAPGQPAAAHAPAAAASAAGEAAHADAAPADKEGKEGKEGEKGKKGGRPPQPPAV
ncbi:MAG TPA: polymer-forming cytoskeletal protein [Kofleriaceae bacterium]|nr:polymer-forming cytoskeletal protein [Kofleriaceae bacterium]